MSTSELNLLVRNGMSSTSLLQERDVTKEEIEVLELDPLVPEENDLIRSLDEIVNDEVKKYFSFEVRKKI